MGCPDHTLPGPQSYFKEADRYLQASPEPVKHDSPTTRDHPRMPGPSPVLLRIEPLPDTDTPLDRPASVYPTSVHSPPPVNEKLGGSNSTMKVFDDSERDSEAIFEAVRGGSISPNMAPTAIGAALRKSRRRTKPRSLAMIGKGGQCLEIL